MPRPADIFSSELLEVCSQLPLDLGTVNEAADQFPLFFGKKDGDRVAKSRAVNKADELFVASLGRCPTAMSLFVTSAYALVLDPLADLEVAGMEYYEVFSNANFFAYVPPAITEMLFAEDVTKIDWAAEVSGLGLILEPIPYMEKEDPNSFKGHMGKMNEYLADCGRVGVPLTNNIVTLAWVPSDVGRV